MLCSARVHFGPKRAPSILPPHLTSRGGDRTLIARVSTCKRSGILRLRQDGAARARLHSVWTDNSEHL